MGNSFLTGNPMQKNPDGSFSVIVSGVGNPPIIVAKFDAVAQQANLASTTLYTVPAGAGGMYRIVAYVVITQAATTSSALPQANVSWTDLDTGLANGFTSTTITVGSSANTLADNSAGAQSSGQVPSSTVINAKAGTNISVSTVGYASVGATPMQFAIHFKLEYLGA